MKKRVMALICAVVLMISMSMTTFAASNPSVSADNVNGTTGTGTTTTSPTTGEPMMVMVAGAAILIGAAGIVVTSKKRA